MELLLEAVKYNQYQRSLCGYLKVIGLLMGMQTAFTKVLVLSLSLGQSICVQAIQVEGLGV